MGPISVALGKDIRYIPHIMICYMYTLLGLTSPFIHWPTGTMQAVEIASGATSPKHTVLDVVAGCGRNQIQIVSLLMVSALMM